MRKPGPDGCYCYVLTNGKCVRCGRLYTDEQSKLWKEGEKRWVTVKRVLGQEVQFA